MSFPAKLIATHRDECKQYEEFTQAAIKANKFKVNEEKQQKNRSTFGCPFATNGCAAQNLDLQGLINHLRQNHQNETNKSGVCPICVTMPWGDPTYICSDVIAHINRRHKFDYNEFVNYEESQDEDAVLQAVLAQSLAEQQGAQAPNADI